VITSKKRGLKTSPVEPLEGEPSKNIPGYIRPNPRFKKGFHPKIWLKKGIKPQEGFFENLETTSRKIELGMSQTWLMK